MGIAYLEVSQISASGRLMRRTVSAHTHCGTSCISDKRVELANLSAPGQEAARRRRRRGRRRVQK